MQWSEKPLLIQASPCPDPLYNDSLLSEVNDELVVCRQRQPGDPLGCQGTEPGTRGACEDRKRDSFTGTWRSSRYEQRHGHGPRQMCPAREQQRHKASRKPADSMWWNTAHAAPGTQRRGGARQYNLRLPIKGCRGPDTLITGDTDTVTQGLSLPHFNPPAPCRGERAVEEQHSVHKNGCDV